MAGGGGVGISRGGGVGVPAPPPGMCRPCASGSVPLPRGNTMPPVGLAGPRLQIDTLIPVPGILTTWSGLRAGIRSPPELGPAGALTAGEVGRIGESAAAAVGVVSPGGFFKSLDVLGGVSVRCAPAPPPRATALAPPAAGRSSGLPSPRCGRFSSLGILFGSTFSTGKPENRSSYEYAPFTCAFTSHSTSSRRACRSSGRFASASAAARSDRAYTTGACGLDRFGWVGCDVHLSDDRLQDWDAGRHRVVRLT